MSEDTVRLTQTVKKGGCAAKLPAGELTKILSKLKPKGLPELAVGVATLDDAALWDLGDGRYLIQTLDFFTPIVDDPESFGAIAAANSISDIYAMGGEPKTALSILAFPTATLPISILESVMRGALNKIEESGACLAGGHSIDDDTLKLGFSVSGFVQKNRAWKNSGAKVGDSLILTKALGTGTLSSALKLSKVKDLWMDAAIKSMSQLNNAPELLKEMAIDAATDITGFGLAAHALQMARASGVSMEINIRKLPVLPGAIDCLNEKILNRAHKTNQEYVQDAVSYQAGTTEYLQWLTLDPQTSGGLLLSVPADSEKAVLEKLVKRFDKTCVIGKVTQMQASSKIFFL